MSAVRWTAWCRFERSRIALVADPVTELFVQDAINIRHIQSRKPSRNAVLHCIELVRWYSTRTARNRKNLTKALPPDVALERCLLHLPRSGQHIA